MPPAELEEERALEREVERRAFWLAFLFMLAVAVVNATTILIEMDRRGAAIDPLRPFVEELTSVAVFVALFPLVVWFVRRAPITLETWRSAVLVHFLGSLAFSALHVTGMVLLRKAIFPALLSQPYVFFESPMREAVYEYRKDALTYASFVLVLHLLHRLADHRREIAAARADARQTGRLTLKCGGRTIWVPGDAFEWAEAAGNYVEVKAQGKAHLARISLSALESQLEEAGLDIARVHRSFLVNRRKVAQIDPLGDGDFRVQMADGSEIRGSRRYRANLLG